ncbi:hypothetical protein [Nesterenkonia sedimenti]|nr:hypothetical protein [Nesterenkonia sedimenti]
MMSTSVLIALVAVPLMAAAFVMLPAATESEEADASPIEGTMSNVQIRPSYDRSLCLTAVN